MKISSHSSCLLLAALGALLVSPLPTASAKNPPTAFPVKELIDRDGMHYIKPGATESTVRHFLGSPLYQPTKTMWVYHRYVADRDDANALDCHNLLITFDAKNRVESLKLINDEALAVITKAATKYPAALPNAVFAINQ